MSDHEAEDRKLAEAIRRVLYGESFDPVDADRVESLILPSITQAREAERKALETEQEISKTLRDAIKAEQAISAEERAKKDQLQRRLDFLEGVSEDEQSGWCLIHKRQFAANAHEDGDECQICRAEAAERERDEASEDALRNFRAAEAALAQAKGYREALEEVALSPSLNCARGHGNSCDCAGDLLREALAAAPKPEEPKP